MLQDLSNGIMGGPIWCFFSFPTKAPNIHNSCTNATFKVHLGVIRLHPLHFPPFMKMCFTPQHTFSLMGPCTSHFVANPMLGLQQFSQMAIQPRLVKNKMLGPTIAPYFLTTFFS